MFFQCSITDIIQQRLLNTDQVDESRFSPDLAAALLNDCRTAMTRITTVSVQILLTNHYFSFPIFSYPKEQRRRKIFFNVFDVYSMLWAVNILTLNCNTVYKPYLVQNQSKSQTYVSFKLYFKRTIAFNWLNAISSWILPRCFCKRIETKEYTHDQFCFRGTQQQTVLLQSKEKVFGQLEELINVGVDKWAYSFPRTCLHWISFKIFVMHYRLCSKYPQWTKTVRFQTRKWPVYISMFTGEYEIRFLMIFIARIRFV